MIYVFFFFFFFSSRRRHTRFSRDWSSDVCSSDLSRSARARAPGAPPRAGSAGKWPGPPSRAARAGRSRGDRRDAPFVAPAVERRLEPFVQYVHPLHLTHEPRRQDEHVRVIVLAREL